jgi:hypothetical protein
MEKIKNNIRNNAAIYLLIIAVIIIFLIIKFVGNKQTTEEELDTSMFNVVTTENVDKIFNSTKAEILVIGSKECSATKDFESIMKLSSAKEQYIINYMELLDEDKDSTSYKTFIEKLDLPYNIDGKDKKLRDYMGATPMIIVIKNKKVVYGMIGSISETALTQLAYTYGVSNEEN